MKNLRINSISPKAALLFAFLLGAIVQVQAQNLRMPEAGEVFRNHRVVNSGNTWRVTDPNATNPDPKTDFPNTAYGIPVDDLEGAVRAELVIDYWGGHVGTDDRHLRFNNNDWIELPDLSTGTPRSNCYLQAVNFVIDIPISHLVEGTNTLEGLSGGQVCYGYQWGLWAMYGQILRIYYDPETKPHPTGGITSPVSGEIIGENPLISVNATSNVGVQEVDFFAHFNGYDPDGDGRFADWQVSYNKGANMANHVGTDKFSPFAKGWNTNIVPDQPPGAVRLIAHIRDNDGYTYVTEEIRDLTLQRTGESVKIYRSAGLKENFQVRNNEDEDLYITIPQEDDMNSIVAATFLVRSWNGLHTTSSTTINGFEIPIYGKDHRYEYNKIGLGTGSMLVNGLNTVNIFNSELEEHGIEILWPGPALIVRYNTASQDQTLFPALVGFEETSGPDVFDLTTNGNDGTIFGNAVRTPNGRYGNGILFDGISGQVDLGVIDFPGEALTVSLWAYVDSTSSPDARLFAKAIGTNPTEGQVIVSLHNVNGVRYRLATTTGYNDVISHGSLTTDAWNHIAVTYDGQTQRIYVNGVQKKVSGKIGAIDNGSNVPVWLGDNPGGDRKAFKGRIDELRIYSSAQVLDQIISDMNTAVADSDLTAPSIPANLAAVLDSNTSSMLAWDASTDETAVNGYNIYRDGILIGTTIATTYQDELLFPNRTYGYTVTAFDLQGNQSAQSNISSVTTPPDLQSPTTPQNLTASTSAFSVSLNWTGSLDDTGIAFYRIYRNGEEVGTSTAAFYNDSGLSVETTYVYQVMAVDFIGNFSGLSNLVLATTLSEPANPTLLLGLPFEEESGDFAFDSSGYRRDGLLTDGVLRSTEGKFGSAVEFRGNSGHVDIGTLDIPGSELTIAAWIKPDDFGKKDARIISKATGSTENQHYWMLSTINDIDNQIKLRARLKTNSGSTKTLIGTTPLSAGVWTHLAATYDGAELKLYVNGTLDASLAMEGDIAKNSNVKAAIGDQPQGDRNFDGLIDEVRIHTIALNELEIQSLMDQLLPGPGGANIVPMVSEIDDQVIFRDTSTGPISFTVDDVGTAPDSLLITGTSYGSSVVPQSGIAFGGTGKNRTVTITPALGTTGSALVSVIVDDGEASTTESFTVSVVTPGNTAPTVSSISEQNIGVDTSTGDIQFSISDGETNVESLSVSASSDNPLLVPFSGISIGGSGSNRTISITPAAGQTGTALITVTVSDGEFFIDETFNLIVSPPFDTSLWLGLPFEEEFGTTVFDISENSHDGTMSAGVNRTALGNHGRALEFEGTGGSVNLGTLDIPGSALTIAAWINPDDFDIADGRIISKASGVADSQHFWMLSTITSGGSTKLRMRLKTTSGDTQTLVGSSAIPINAWTHVAATYDGSEMRIFINGILDGSLSASGAIAQNSTIPASIGDQPQGGRNFDGLIDELQIYTQALSISEIQTVMGAALDPPNASPSISSIDDQSIFKDSSTDDLAFTITDAETAPFLLNLSAVSDNAALVPQSGIAFGGAGNNREITITPAVGQTGNAVITVTVSDGEASVDEIFAITVVTPGNTAPTVSAIDDLDIVPDTSTGPIPFTVNDALTDPNSLIISVATDNTALVPISGISMSGSGTDRFIDITPVLGETGAALITIVVDDGEFFVEESFTLSVTSPIHPDLIVGLPFEEVSGNIVYDVSPNMNDGLLTAGVNRATDTGRGGVLVFSGNGGLASLGNLDIPGSELTIGAWIRPDDFGIQDARIVSKATGLTDNQHFWMLSTINTGNGPKLRMRLQNSNGDTDSLVGISDLSAGVWTHVAGTYDGAAMRIYINGVLDAEIPFSGSIIQNFNVPVAIGDQPQGGRSFDGLIDDVKIYGRALDQTDVQVIMSGNLAVPNAEPSISVINDLTALVNTSTNPIPFTVSDAKTSPYQLSLSVASDNPTLIPLGGITLGGAGNNRTITLTPAAGETGNALITVSLSDGVFSVDESFTITVVTPGNTPPSISGIDDLDIIPSGTTGPISFTVSDTETASNLLTVTVATDNPTVVPLSGITIDGSGANRTVTINPAVGKVGVAEITLTASDGELFFDQAFSLSIIAPVHPDLLLGLEFEEESGTVVFDRSSNANNGVMTTGANRSTEGQSGNALLLSGNGGHVDLGNLDIPGSALTLAAWINPDDFGVADGRIISKAAGTTNNDHFWMLSTVSSGGGIKLRMRLKTTGGDTATVIGSTNLVEGVWTHVAGVYDGTSIKVFVNGVLDGSLAWTGDIIQDGSVPVAVGDQPQGGINFDGLIDDVQIFVRAFVQTEIQDIMNGLLSVPNTPPSISSIDDQFIEMNAISGPVAFSIDDVETTGYLLNITATSDDQVLVPNNNIVISGSGANRTITVTPVAGYTGPATITLTVDDGEFFVDETYILRVVTPGNTPPTISAISDQVLNFGSATGDLSFTVGDSDTDASLLTLTAASSNTVLVPLGGISFGGSGANRTISVAPASIQSGSALVTVTVGDGELFTEETFTVSIDPPFDSSLLLGLPFEEESGDIAYDISLNLNDGGLFDGVLRSNFGKFGRATEFSGNGGLVDLYNLDIPGSALTIAAWIKPDDFGVQDGRIVSKANGGLINDHYWMLSTVKVNGIPKLRMRLKTTSGVTSTLIGATTLNAGVWTHVAATFDGSELRLYVNGLLDATLALTGGIAQNAGIAAAIGAQPQGDRNFDGLIDDFRIYTQALAEANIQAIITEPLVQVGVIDASPTISPIDDQSVFQDHSTADIPFVIGDMETDPSLLTLTVTTDNLALVPMGSISIAGTGADRTLSIIPVAGLSGSAQIELAVDDGNSVTNESFTLLVREPVGSTGWWNPSWNYRTSFEILANGSDRTDAVADIPIDFTALLTSRGQTAAIDVSTLRLIEVDSNDNFLDDSVPFQFDPDAAFDAQTNAVGTLILKITGSTPASATRYYQLYFTPAGTGATASIIPSELVTTDDIMDEGQLSVRVETPTGTLFYHKMGAGFSSWIDIEGNDWIDYHPTGGSLGNFRGIPNAVYPEGHFHPGATTATSSILWSGPLKTTIHSITNDSQWECVWEIYGSHARLTVLNAGHPFWFLYEGTPGGELDLNTDLIVRSDGLAITVSEQWIQDIVGDEWAYFADPDVGRSLFFTMHETDAATDTYRDFEDNMTVFAFGRSALQTNPFLNGTPKRFTMGFVEQTMFSPMSSAIYSSYSDLAINTFGTILQSESNNAPVVTLTGPADGSSSPEGDPVDFTGLASDAEDSDITASLSWSSDIDGPISGSGAAVSTSTLSVGTHVITASVVDSGLLMGSSSISITILPNAPPDVTITGPVDGTLFLQGNSINFTGIAIDPEDGDITAGLGWSSDLDGAIPGSGGSVSTSSLSVGIHTITATVADSDLLANIDTIQVVVGIPSVAPSVNITNPAIGAFFNQGDSINFTATAIDAEDGDITGSLTWSSSIDGPISGSGGSVSTSTLSIGIHDITATVSDSGFIPGSDTISVTVGITSTAPSVTITEPADDAFFTSGDSVNFVANAVDAEDGDLTNTLIWKSNIDGPITGSGGNVSTSNLSVGIHTITATSLDSGLVSGSDSIAITVAAATTPAVVTITNPGDGSFFTQGGSINLTGTAIDAEDGDITSTLAWESDVDGAISGSGGSVFTSTLSLGKHTITATAIDSGLLPSKTSIDVFVSIVSTAPVVTISQPENDSFINQGDSTDLVATANDAEDGDITSAITWSSDIDGGIAGVGGSISTDSLSVGIHTITATVVDGGFVPGFDSITLTVRAASNPPLVTITAPLNGSFTNQGDTINFTGAASDIEDGDITSTLVWESDIDGTISGSGGAVSTSALSVGVHTITATATDNGYLPGSGSITITVRLLSDPPIVSFITPADGAFFAQGDGISFSATATDTEDGDITGTLTWNSNIDGAIPGSGGSVSTSSLSVGVHTITATATDSGFLPGSGTINVAVSAVSNAPVVVITGPSSGSQFDQNATINFIGTALDGDDGDITNSLTWSSDIDGPISGSGAFVSTSTLSVGYHAITATAIDSGFLPGSDTIYIAVMGLSDAPVVTITGPADGSSFSQGAEIDFTATASDTEDGDVTPSLVWSSDIDGLLSGSGGAVSIRTLSPGTHTITASAIDSGLRPGFASISVTVNILVGQIVSDDFSSGSLNPGTWSIVDPVGDGIVSTNTGALVISLPEGEDHDVWTGGNRSVRVMQDVFDTDFEMEVRFVSEMPEEYTMQGFIIEQDANNFLRFDFVRFPASVIVFSASFVGTTPTTHINTSIPFSDNYYIRVNRTGDLWTMHYSFDGEVWIEAGSYTYPLTVAQAGVYAGNASGADSPAFTLIADYVFNTAVPVFQQDAQIDIVVSGEGMAGVTPNQEYYQAGDQVQLTAVAADGWAFDGWSGDIAEADNPLSLTVTEDVEIFALFLPTDGRPVIDLWYGDYQRFGVWGVPQPQINILGNVIISAQIESLSYSLNGVDKGEITMGPEENIRLARPGDFNIEIPYTELQEGVNNQVTITATGFDSTVYTRDVTIESDIYNVWPRPYAIDWSQVSSIDEVAQVVDGKWEIVAGGVKATESHYDRLIAIGDIEWTDYEVTVPITVHYVDHQPPPDEPLVGIMLRWDGHEKVGSEQPGVEWRPIGAMGVHGWYAEGSRGGHHFQIFETGSDKFAGYNGQTLPLDTTYYFKIRVESSSEQPGGFYSFKVWPAGQLEPGAWGITRQAAAGLPEGSLLLVAHYVEATFGNIVVTSLEPNEAPSVSITGPAAGDTFIAGVPVDFTATANDSEDGDITKSIFWSSNIDGPIAGLGGFISTNALSVGDHTITAAVVDSDSSPSIATLSINIGVNTPPVTSISAPSQGASFLAGVPITFTATANDFDDGDITDTITWVSSLDGPLEGTGGSISATIFSVGTHVITATATDLGSLTGSDDVTIDIQFNPNNEPVLNISSPEDGASFTAGDSINFTATASDAEDGNITGSIIWSSDLDGALPGSGGSIFSSTLSVGTHVIRASATDSGFFSGFSEITVVIIPNNIPVVSISDPADNSIYTVGDPINFVGSASDVEDGDITSAILWSSNIDGQIAGVGGSVSTSSLTGGTHLITATAIDAFSGSGSDSITVVVNTPRGPIVSDDFTTGSLNTNLWTFVNPIGDGSQSMSGGVLSLAVPAGTDHDIWTGGNRSARVVQRIDDTDFGFQSKFVTTPSEQFQFQGLLIEQDATNFIRFDVISTGNSLLIFGANFLNGNPVTLFSLPISVSSAYFLRIERLGNQFTMQYSFDGSNWVTAGTLNRSLNVLHAGVHAGNASGSNSPAFTAEIDYAFNTASPIVPEDAGGSNTAPVVEITSPSDGSSYKKGETIDFIAIANDAENGDVSASINWSSDLDGLISGTGGSISTYDLSVGTHEITALGTDVGALTGSDSITVVVNESGPILSDDFSTGVLNTNLWTFVNPVGDGSYLANANTLSLSVPGGTEHDIWTGGNQSSRIIQRIDDTDFGLQAKFVSTPSMQFQVQGLLIEQDATNFVRCDFYSNGTFLYVFAANFVNGSPTVLFNKKINVASAYFLKVDRTGDQFTMRYSYDGTNWIFGGILNRALVVNNVGAHVGNSSGASSPAFTAEIDYVFNTASPIVPED